MRIKKTAKVSIVEEAPVEKRPTKFKRITLHSLFSDNEEIWVRNMSGRRGKEPGNIVMQIGNPPHIDKLVVPPGEDPVCLTEQSTHEMLKNCLDLVKLVNIGALELLDPEKAEQYYTDNKERRAVVEAKIAKILSNTRENVPEPRRVDGSDDMDLRPKKRPMILDEMVPQAKTRKRVANVHPKINDICLKSKHGAISERDALETLMEQAPALKEADYQYLMNNSAFHGLKKWAKQQLLALAEEE